MQETKETSPREGNQKRPYQKPRIIFHEQLETLAVDCSDPMFGKDGGCMAASS